MQLDQLEQEKTASEEDRRLAQEGLEVAQIELDRAKEARDTIDQVNKLEKAGAVALKRYQYDPLDGLVDAIRIGEQAQYLSIQRGKEGFAVSPRYTLQTILDTVENRAGKSLQPKTLLAHRGDVNRVTFSADGRRIVTASYDNTARVWDAESGTELATLSGHEGSVRTAEFSADGRRIVTASDDNTARVWDAESGTELATLSGHEGSVRTAEFSADGRRIVTASYDNTARVWDAESGTELATLSGHEGSVLTAEFSADGRRIVTASSDNTARVVPVETLDQLLMRGCHWIRNYLVVNPQALKELPTCQVPDIIQRSAPHLVEDSRRLARNGKLQDAVKGFALAKQWDPNVDLDPSTLEIDHDVEAIANKLAAPAKVSKGEALARAGKIEEAIALFQEALRLDPNVDLDPSTEEVEQDVGAIANRFAELGPRPVR